MINGFRLKNNNYFIDATQTGKIIIYNGCLPETVVLINNNKIFSYIKRRAFNHLQSAIDTIRIYEKKFVKEVK